MTDRFADLDRPGLSVSDLRAALVGVRRGMGRFDLVQETGSTNTDLAAAATRGSEEYPDLSVLVAEHQRAGRGRLDRAWTAPVRSALAVSVLLRPLGSDGSGLASEAYPWMSLLAALALVETLREQAKISAGIKWPNDVVIEGRKLAGILAQLVPAPDAAAPAAVVVGAGVNVSARTEELVVPTATSLALEKAATVDRNVLLKAYVRSLADLYRQFCAVDGDAVVPLSSGISLQESVAGRMVTVGQSVRVKLPAGPDIVGKATALESSGALLVTDRRGAEHTVTAGDILHLRREPM